jgi:CelD/BcsL family acetyltransferase involved in cellulose biosynthesis
VSPGGKLTLHELPDLAAAREDWQRLAPETGSPFSTWEWADCWWRTMRPGGELTLRALRDGDGATVAILPLYVRRRGPLRVIRFVGNGPADQLGPVCAPVDRARVASALRRALDDGIGGWNTAVLERLPGEQDWPTMLGVPLTRSEPSPLLEADGMDFAAWLASRSKNFRDQVRGRERKLGRAHELEFRLSEDPGRLDRDFDELVRLHRLRFGDTSRAFDPPRDALHREFARAALATGILRLWTLELDGRAAAAWLGYRIGGTEWYYQSGRDPEFERESVGFVLMAHTIREALNDGMDAYRLLLGDESYKDRFATADHGLDTIVMSRGLGRLAPLAARAAQAAPHGLRKRLRRLSE